MLAVRITGTKLKTARQFVGWCFVLCCLMLKRPVLLAFYAVNASAYSA
jgi:hypothetical protein